jgi:hypothetical protein
MKRKHNISSNKNKTQRMMRLDQYDKLSDLCVYWRRTFFEKFFL